MRRQLLEGIRQGRAILKSNIELFEWFANSELFQDDADASRRAAEKLRSYLPAYDRMERELLEQQPGGITAPAPRLKGTPPSPPKPEKVRD